MTYADALVMAEDPKALGDDLLSAEEREHLHWVAEEERKGRGEQTDMERFEKGQNIKDR